VTTRAGFLGALVVTGTAWGATQPLSKIAVSTGHGHFGLIFWQLVIGALALGALTALRRRRVPLNRATLRFALVVALIGTVIPNSASYIAVGHLPAGVMSILISTVPMLAFPIALALGADRFGAARLAGLLCGIAGVALIALPEASLPAGAAPWIAVALIGPLFYAMEGNYVATVGTAGLDAIAALALASAVGAAIALPLALGTGQFIDPLAPWGAAERALVASSLLHAGAYAAYVWIAREAGAVFAAQVSYVVTGTGVFWAMAILGERFPPTVWAALGVMMLGLALVQPRPKLAAVLPVATAAAEGRP
jgi:MYXO-CTERM domain-containing protein